MEIIKDYLRGLPEVGFHRWQSYLSLFSLKRPNKGLIPVRWAFPLAWIKERLKRLYFARGGLPSLAVLPKVGFEESSRLRKVCFSLMTAKGRLRRSFELCQRWASILNNGGLSSMTAKGRLRGCKESSRLPGLAELPKVGLFPVRWAFPLAWIKERLKRLYFARGGLPSLAVLPKVGFEESSRLRKVCFSLMTAKGRLRRFFELCQRWASILNNGGLSSSSAKGGLPVLPKVGLISPLVGFLGFDGIRIPLKPEKPLFGLYTVLYGEKVGFEAAKDLRGFKGGLFFELCQRWASIAGSTAKGRLPEVGFEASKVGFSPLVLNTFIYIHIHML